MSNANSCSTEHAVPFIQHVKIRKLVRERLIIKLVCHIRNIYQHTNTYPFIHPKIYDFYEYKTSYIFFSILLKIKAMVGESRRSDDRDEAVRNDKGDEGNLINILVVTITLLLTLYRQYIVINM